METNTIICGRAEDELAKIAAGTFNCCVSSPPYWALRDYGVEGQLGLEPTFEEYIDKLCNIYDQVKRVLRKDGTCFVNLGDTYGTSSGAGDRRGSKQWINQGSCIHEEEGRKTVKGFEKCLCLIPQRFAIEMVNRGWILRNIIIWHKPNPMPSSAKDRFTVDFEYVYFFTKSKRYWFETQYEPMNYPERKYNPDTSNQKCATIDNRLQKGLHDGREQYGNPALGRNKRCVWNIPTQAFSEAHFATYPEKLIEPMIKAGCPEFICKKCGQAREKIYDTSYIVHREAAGPKKLTPEGLSANNYGSMKYAKASAQHHFKGYTDCECNAGFRPGIVLDPFGGSGTTGLVAARLRRDYCLIELNPEYIPMIEKRIAGPELGLTKTDVENGQMSLLV